MPMDYHLHSLFSGDGKSTIEEICRAAVDRGIRRIAITDHHDIGNENYEIRSIGEYLLELDRCSSLFPDLEIARGLEIDFRPETWERMKCVPKSHGIDFALLSLHFIDGVDPYLPEYFDGRSQRDGYVYYLERLARMIDATEGPWVLGHITYVSKFTSFSDPMLRYAEYQDELDEILRRAIHKGYGLEVNASGTKNNAGLLPGADILRRYRELGGEIVTLGSDAHSAADVGRGICDAAAAVQEAGFRYLASYQDLKPVFFRIG